MWKNNRWISDAPPPDSSPAVRLWAPLVFRLLTSRTRRSSTTWRSPSVTSSTSSRTSTQPDCPSHHSWTWTRRSPWPRCLTAQSPRWRSCTRPPTPSLAPSIPLKSHQQLVGRGVSYYCIFYYLMEKIFKMKGIPGESSDGIRTTNLLCYFLMKDRIWNQILGLNPFFCITFQSEPTTAAGSCSLFLATG